MEGFQWNQKHIFFFILTFQNIISKFKVNLLLGELVSSVYSNNDVIKWRKKNVDILHLLIFLGSTKKKSIHENHIDREKKKLRTHVNVLIKTD